MGRTVREGKRNRSLVHGGRSSVPAGPGSQGPRVRASGQGAAGGSPSGIDLFGVPKNS